MTFDLQCDWFSGVGCEWSLFFYHEAPTLKWSIYLKAISWKVLMNEEVSKTDTIFAKTWSEIVLFLDFATSKHQ